MALFCTFYICRLFMILSLKRDADELLIEDKRVAHTSLLLSTGFASINFYQFLTKVYYQRSILEL